MGTSTILVKDCNGHPRHLGEGPRWGPQPSWRSYMTGTPTTLEKDHDRDPGHIGEGPRWESMPSLRRTVLGTPAILKKDPPPATAVQPRRTRSGRTPPLTRGAIIQPSAHHRPRRRRSHPVPGVPKRSLSPPSSCHCGGCPRGPVGRWVLRQFCGRRGSCLALFKAA